MGAVEKAMDKEYECPFCGRLTPGHMVEEETFEAKLSRHSQSGFLFTTLHYCSRCCKVSFIMMGNVNKEIVHYTYPPHGIKEFPEYVPLAIRQDYAEACSIYQLSPKSAATLSRRCIQGMIHDFWGIHEKNLNAELTALRDKIPSLQWQAIDGLRKIGNIGAHMEQEIDRIVDVEPQEAEKLLRLIEFLVCQWYVARHDQDQMLREIAEIAAEKEDARQTL